MTENRLNNCMIMHIHKCITDTLNLHEIAKEFIHAKEERLKYFGNFHTQ